MSSKPFALLPTAYRAVRGPVVIAVMDGVGLAAADAGNAVAQARAPMLAGLMRGPLYCPLRAHGLAVGLAPSDMGNSEVGHNALGAGQVFDQGAKRVGEAFATGEAFEGQAFKELVAHVIAHDTSLHLIGLLSDGNVHSHIDHTIALLMHADAAGVKEVRLHVLWDGRDVPRASAQIYLKRLETALATINGKHSRTYLIASGGGRMQITMDRYGADWPMVARGWAAHVHGEGPRYKSAQLALEAQRANNPGIGDQNLPAFVVEDIHGPVGRIQDGDAVVVTNFRGDRVLELCQAFEDDDFSAFDRGPRPDVHFVGMTLYDGEAKRPRRYLIAPPQITNTLGEALSARGIAQLACSETQKFGHVTYFWNGNRALPFDAKLEHSIEVPSRKTPFEAQPEMRAKEIVQATRAALSARPFGLARVNFANGDMVGHTGHLKATIAAIEVVDRAISELAQAVMAVNGALIVTADHGNAEDMLEREPATNTIRLDGRGQPIPKTSHSTNPVPMGILLAPQDQARFALSPAAKDQPGLGNVAATCLTLMGLEAPPDAYLPSLLEVVDSRVGR